MKVHLWGNSQANPKVGSTHPAGKVPHRSLMWGVATDTADACRCHVWVLFFCFFWDSCWLSSDSRRLGFNLHRFELISTEQGQFDQNQVASAKLDCISRRLKKAKIGLESCRNSRNRLWMRPKHPKSVLPQFYCFLFCFVFLAFFLCFVNQSHTNVFFKNILIVIY